MSNVTNVFYIYYLKYARISQFGFLDGFSFTEVTQDSNSNTSSDDIYRQLMVYLKLLALHQR